MTSIDNGRILCIYFLWYFTTFHPIYHLICHHPWWPKRIDRSLFQWYIAPWLDLLPCLEELLMRRAVFTIVNCTSWCVTCNEPHCKRYQKMNEVDLSRICILVCAWSWLFNPYIWQQIYGAEMQGDVNDTLIAAWINVEDWLCQKQRYKRVYLSTDVSAVIVQQVRTYQHFLFCMREIALCNWLSSRCWL